MRFGMIRTLRLNGGLSCKQETHNKTLDTNTCPAMSRNLIVSLLGDWCSDARPRAGVGQL
jgi:hypothetical protein